MELFTRWTLYTVPWFFQLTVAGSQPSVARGAAPALVGALWGLSVVQNLLAAPMLRRGLDHRLRGGATAPRLTGVAAALMVAGLGVTVALEATGALREPGSAVLAIALSVAPFSTGYAVLVSVRRFTAVHAVVAVAVAAAVGAARPDPVAPVSALLAVSLVGAVFLCTVRGSVWVLVVMWEAEANRETQARLAVAEERLRFARDLHDVMGRDLAVIALKSELAVQLARRERPEAVGQMEEVQRIAQRSHKEVREVVRGYRDADLQVELAGARSVLTAARVECRIEDGGVVELPEAVRSALGWVVREGTTNVLRHAEAARCTVRVRVDGAGRRAATAVLEMENDGVGGTEGAEGAAGEPDMAPDGPRATPGSGLTGLRERLAVLGGTLESGPGERGTFRLRAELPLEAAS
ncbi:histidine kinase [Streptomyces sp. NPDC048636]|uniref:sensor histidine kinase n=1 Tax=Streptomyces sp. NPDC048636 TaxID=3155762 RepID=UPI0034351EBC